MKIAVAQTPPSVKEMDQIAVAQTPPSVNKNILPSVNKKFDYVNEFIKKNRNLPHWQNPGSIYFITFKTYKGLILDDHSKQIIYDNIIHYNRIKYQLLSFVIMPDHIHIILQPNEIKSGEYVNLSEIMQALKGFASKQIIKYLTQLSLTEFNIAQSANIQTQTGASELPLKHIFQAESFDRIIRNDDELYEKMNYILNNPVKRELVKNGYEYEWYYLTEERQ